MALNNFRKCLDVVLGFEGGYVNHPKDPGGATNMGITIATLSEHLGRQASVEDVQNISKQTVEKIYKERYWDEIKGDLLPKNVDLVMFDLAVMAGPGRCAMIVQEMVGAKADGDIGPNTIKALNEYIKTFGAYTFIITFRGKKMAFMESLTTYKTFGKGWASRNNKVIGLALDQETGEQ